MSDVNSAGIYIGKGSDKAAVRNNRIHNAMHAIWSVSARGVTIEHNVIDGKKNLERNYRGNGIYLTDSQEAVVAENTMDYCRDGIYLEVTHDGKDHRERSKKFAVRHPHHVGGPERLFPGTRSSGNLVGHRGHVFETVRGHR